MVSSIALESLVQRGRSALYIDLVSLYQESQDALREAYKASPAQINMGLKNIDFVERLKTTVRKHTGMVLAKVVIDERREPNAYATIIESATTSKALRAGTVTYGMVMEKIDRYYNDRTAQLSMPTVDTPLGFVFGIATAFWAMRNEDKSYYFTPDECAAITLHEIGHFDHWIRTGFRVYERTLDAADIVNYIKATPDKEVILAILDKIQKSKHIDKSWDKIIKATYEYFRTTNSFDDPLYVEALSTLTVLMEAELANFSLPLFNMFYNGDKGRVTTRLHDIDSERSADEFASRNGAYSAMTSALSKLERIRSSDATLLMKQFMWTPPALVVGLLLKLHTIFDVAAEDIAQGYDPLLRRLELITQTAKHAFADANLPENIKDDIKRQIRESEGYIAGYRSSMHRQFRAKLKEWKDNVGKFGRILSSPIHNRLSGDYERLQDSTRSLSRNPLYYLAQK